MRRLLIAIPTMLAGMLACTPPPPPAPVATTIVIYDAQGAPAEGVTLQFHDADGLPLEIAQTDATGRAEALDLPDGAMVSILQTLTGHRRITTIQSIDVGGTLQIGNPVPWDQEVGSIDVTLPDYPGAAEYSVSPGNWHAEYYPAAGTYSIPIEAGAVAADGRVSAVAYALDDSGNVLAHSVSEPAALTDEIVFTSWGTQWTSVPVDVIDATPTGIIHTWTRAMLRGVELGTVDIAGPLSTPASFDISLPEGLTPAHYSAILRNITESNGSYSLVRARNFETHERLSIESSQFLPLVVMQPLDTTEAARPVISWEPDYDPVTVGADLNVALLAWDITNAQGTLGTHEWVILLPAKARQVQVPQLAPELSELWQPTSSSDFTEPSVVIRGSSAYDGWNDLLEAWATEGIGQEAEPIAATFFLEALTATGRGPVSEDTLEQAVYGNLYGTWLDPH